VAWVLDGATVESGAVRSGEIEVRQATPEDATRLAAWLEPYRAQIPGIGAPTRILNELHRRLRKGDMYLIGEVRDEPVLLVGLSFDRATLRFGVEVLLRPDEVYLNTLFAFPAARSRSLAAVAARGMASVQRQAVERLRARGARWGCAWVNPLNARVRKAAERMGWRPVGHVKQIYLRGSRTPLLTIVTTDPTDAGAAWCSPGRLRCGGLVLFRRGRPQSPGRPS
jgi:hypothetical protein